MPLHLPSELRPRFRDGVLDQTQSLLLDDGALVIESLEDELGDFFDDAGVGGAEELADLFELVDGGDLVLVGGDGVNHARAPV